VKGCSAIELAAVVVCVACTSVHVFVHVDTSTPIIRHPLDANRWCILHIDTTNNERGRRFRLSNYISLLDMSVCLDHRGSNVFTNQFLHHIVSTCLLHDLPDYNLLSTQALQRSYCSNSRRHETCMPSWNTVH
jgi:hypothetical protein